MTEFHEIIPVMIRVGIVMLTAFIIMGIVAIAIYTFETRRMVKKMEGYDK